MAEGHRVAARSVLEGHPLPCDAGDRRASGRTSASHIPAAWRQTETQSPSKSLHEKQLFCACSHSLCSNLFRYPRSEPAQHDAARLRARSNSHTVAVSTAAPISRLRRARAQEDETILFERHFRPCPGSVHPPGSAGIDQIPEDFRIPITRG